MKIQNYKYMLGLAFAALVGIVSFQSNNVSELIKSATAKQALNGSSNKTSINKANLIAFSPDGNRLAILDQGGAITVKDVVTSQTLWFHFDPSNTSVTGLIFSPGGKTLASYGENAVNLWNTETGQEKGSIPLKETSAALLQLAFSPDGKRMAGANQEQEILFWNLESGSPKPKVLSQGLNFQEIKFSPDSQFLVSGTGGKNSKILFWDSKTARLIKELATDETIAEVAFSTDSKALAWIGQSGQLKVVDVFSGTVKRVIETKEDLTSLAFNPVNNVLAVGSKGNDPKFQLWNADTGELILSRKTEGLAAVTKLIFNKAGTLLASVGNDNKITVWSLPNGDVQQLLSGHAGSISKAAFNTTKQDTLAAVGANGQIIVWNSATGFVQQDFQVPVWSPALLNSQQSTIAAKSGVASQTTSSNLSNNSVNNPTVSVAKNQTSSRGKKVKNRNVKKWKGINALAFNTDGTEMGAGDAEGTIRIFKKNGDLRWKMSGHHGKAITGVGSRKKGSQWITIGADTEIKVWDNKTGNLLKTFYGPEHPPKTVAVSSDDRFLAVAGEDTRIFLYDVSEGKLKQIFYGSADFVNGLAFSPDGKILASGGSDGNVLLWEISSGKRLETLSGHTDEVNSVAISPDGGLIASASADSTVILWNLHDGQKFKVLTGHQGGVRSVNFSPNGKKLVSAGDDSRMLVWNPATGQLRKRMAGSAGAVNAVVFDPSGNLHCGNENGEISGFDSETGDKLETINVPVSSGPKPQARYTDPLHPTLQANKSVAMTTHLADEEFNKGIQYSSQSLVGFVANKLLDWLIPVAKADPNQGPGGPILIITPTTASSYGHYYAEILRNEGLNEFAVAAIGSVNATMLNGYDVVILSQMTLTPTQVTMFNTWVNNGGNLIAMRPDTQLASLLGLTSAGSTLQNGYLLVNTSAAPGYGIVGETIQYHGFADLYTLNGASAIATLYSNATTATTNPAVTLRSVGSAGGQAAAFTYDLARSVIYTRQGNPAWIGQNRDRGVSSVAAAVIRSNDLYYGADPVDIQPDWIDFNKLTIPQADEQQRLLANMITEMIRDKKPLPRFWYFPAGVKSAVLMTGDDHANGGTIGLFNTFITQSPSGCSVQNWECYRYTSYAYTNIPMTQLQAQNYNNQGFEVGLHINTGCSDFTPASLEANYAQQVADFNTKFSNALAPVTMRHHCLVWSDWATGVKTQINHGIRLDTSYYFWPPSWVLDRPGLFTGSAMPMRFADADGSLIDAYQATSQMTDESGQTYPITIDSLLNKAVGTEGYYGVYNVNAHTDLPSNPVADSVLAAAVSRGVPVISSRQLLNWLDFRNSSFFSGMTWSGNTLSFTVTPGSVSTSAPEGVPSNRLQVLLPKKSSNGILASLTRNGSPKSYSNITIKGVDYAAISDNTSGVSGAYVATYAADTTPPTVLSRTPVGGATGVILSASVSATFSEAIDPATITASTFQLVGPGSTVVPSQVTYNSNTLTATLTPSSALTANTLYTATVKGGSTAPQVKDLAGNPVSANVTWSFTTETQPCSSSTCSAWPPNAVPATPSVSDPGAVELGVKFRTDVAGYVTGVRFYKGATNTGTHTGNLWSSTGTLLASAIFTGETGSGWQQVNFSIPVQIDPNTTYVASYHAPNGKYALSNSPEFLSQGVDNGPIHLLRNGIDGGNGVYAYGTSSSFPQNTFQGSNYWVDVVFTTNSTDTTPPTVASQTPALGATNVATNSAVTATFSEPMDAATITASTVELRNTVTSALVAATANYNSATRTVTLTPNASLTASTQYTATIKGGATDPRVKDLAGLAMAADFSWNFTTAAAGSPSCASVTSIWPSNPTPATLQDPDTNAVELGVKFRSTVNGYICGIRFYKGVNNTGTHVGKLWNITGGTPLATATFTNETASGWQQVSFASPVQITANTVYIASYYAPNGRYSTNNNYFTTGVTNGSLYALADGENGGNGVYGYIAGGGFPANTFQKENYWVDVLFTTNIGPDTTLPTVSSTVPTTNATGVAPTAPISITFSEPMDADTITASSIELRNTSTNALVTAAVSYDSASRTVTLTPSASLTATTQYTALVRGGTTDPRVKDLAGLALATNYTWNFTTGAAGATGCSGGTSTIWPGTTVPAVSGNADTRSVELGVKFRSTQNGYICGIRFYKDSTNTGTHVGNLWNATTGANMGTVTFTGETVSGWQQMNFASPVQIIANTTYVASYLAPAGRYSINNNFFTAGVTNGPLYAFGSAESGGNGVYAYGSGGIMPSNTYQASNYWVDVAYTTNIGPDTTAPTVEQTLPSSNATGVVPSNLVTVKFSEAMDPATINGTSNIELRNSANALVAATLSYNPATNTATLTPNSSLAVSTQYTAKVKAGTVKDLAQNALVADYTWQFTTGADPCSVGGNPIVCENALPGNPSSEWDISGAGDLSIQGFATDISVNRGQTVNFKIDTPSNDYRLDIYRMGYYSGAGARKVATVQPTSFPIQPACLTNSTGLIDCGNWSVTASWSVPSNAVSGVYFAKVIREDGGNNGASHIVFIVRDDASTSDILFQTADTTWQAYNNYGGNNLYGGSGPGGGLSGNGRAYKVSYNRPFYTRNVDNGQDWVFNAEYPMIRWLEANGYNVSYFTGIDSDRFGNLIRNHKLFMSNAHDEYWSGQQRANVEAARDAAINPVNLAFFSGNEVFWKTRWENSISSPATAYRTLVCYKETHQYAANGSIDPSSEWTGTWRDPRGTPPADGGRPENELIGSIFTVNAGATTSITVPEADGKMRFWRNTTIANLTAGSTATLPFATLGYEWDEDLDNGFRPAGLVRLSTTIVPSAPVLSDYGSIFGSGIANHALTLYRAPSGAIVFGSGTIQWAWGLDSNHDLGNTPPSPAMQQATVNLFADMGIQPGTIQSGLTVATPSTDATAPSSAITSPTAGANVQPGTLVIISGTASDVGGRVGGVEVSVDGGATWHPASGRTSWTYSWNTPTTNGPANIRVRAVDDSLNMQIPGSGINVTVGTGGDITPPTNPSNLVAQQTSGTQVNLTWTASADASGIAGYRVERCSGSTTCTNFAEIAAPISSPFLNTGLTEGTIYRYRVRAIDNSGIFSTGYSNIVTITPDATAPGSPTGLNATVISDTRIDLSWTASTDNVAVTGYRIERCANVGCSAFSEIGTSANTNFSSTGLTAGTSYSYRVRANDAVPNLSGYSNTVTAIPQAQNLPVAVTDTFLYVANVTRTVNSPGVLVNDTDPLSRPLSAQLVAGSLVNGGTLNLNTNGSFTYLRTTGSNTVSFAYRASASGALSLPTTGATVNLRVDAAPTTVADNCTYDRSANTVTQPARCSVVGTRQVSMNVALNDTDSNTATNIPTDGVGSTVVPSTVVITALTTAGVTVNANAACGQAAIGTSSTNATIQNNCNGTITVTMTAANISNIAYSYTIKDDLAATSTARLVTLSNVA